MDQGQELAFHYDLSATFAQGLTLSKHLHPPRRSPHHNAAPRILKTKTSKKPRKAKLILLESTDVANDDAKVLRKRSFRERVLASSDCPSSYNATSSIFLPATTWIGIAFQSLVVPAVVLPSYAGCHLML